LFHTSHPQLCGALRRSKKWTQVSAVLYGGNKVKSQRSIARTTKSSAHMNAGYGGHFRAVQGFKYLGLREEVKTE
jgi:ribosomal protein L25 (general stress protein Ctc)